MAERRPWSHEERLLVFRLYCRTPFGRLHRSNPDIVAVAEKIGRTPSAVAMKACNFASLDPVQRARKIVALGNASKEDRRLWDAFDANPVDIAFEAESTAARYRLPESQCSEESVEIPEGPTERIQKIRTRRVQGFFRAAVLASYDYRCALSDMTVLALLNASHIVPWSVDETRRADPRNGILLNTLLDRAFDRGLITFDESRRLVVSCLLKTKDRPRYQEGAILDLEGKSLRSPNRFLPDLTAMAYHREQIFRDN